MARQHTGDAPVKNGHCEKRDIVRLKCLCQFPSDHEKGGGQQRLQVPEKHIVFAIGTEASTDRVGVTAVHIKPMMIHDGCAHHIHGRPVADIHVAAGKNAAQTDCDQEKPQCR